MDNQWTNVEFCYGQPYDETKLDSILASGRDFVTDANIESRIGRSRI